MLEAVNTVRLKFTHTDQPSPLDIAADVAKLPTALGNNNVSLGVRRQPTQRSNLSDAFAESKRAPIFVPSWAVQRIGIPPSSRNRTGRRWVSDAECSSF